MGNVAVDGCLGLLFGLDGIDVDVHAEVDHHAALAGVDGTAHDIDFHHAATVDAQCFGAQLREPFGRGDRGRVGADIKSV